MLGKGDKAVELYKMITPIEHARTKEAANKYKVEPYVLAADVYGAQNLAGSGGWTWYTGSSSWYYLAGIQYILGLNIYHNTMSFKPCIPKFWVNLRLDINLAIVFITLKSKILMEKIQVFQKY